MISGLTDIGFASSLNGSTVGAVTEPNNDGVYTAKLTSTAAGAATVKVQQGGADITGVASQTVTFTHKVGAPVPVPANLKFTPATLAGDGTKGKVSYAVEDSTGAPVTNLTNVTFEKSGAQAATTDIGTVAESSTTPGTYEADFSGTHAGKVTIKVSIGGTAQTGVTKDFTFS